MSLLEDFFKVCDYKITGGSDYGWQCFGPDAYYLDSEVPDSYTLSILFDRKDQTTYQLEVFDLENNRAYRWVAPSWAQAQADEARQRGVDNSEAWDDVKFVTLETVEDFWEKAQAIVNSEEYDTRVSVPITLPDEELFILMKMAHERDITFNQLVEEILREQLGMK